MRTAPCSPWSEEYLEQNIRIISPDIGGGFGNKVPVYPGYVCAVVASLTPGKAGHRIESRSENLQSTGFARDYHMSAEIAADRDGTVKALRVKTLADHGAFNAAAQPTKYPQPGCSASAPGPTISQMRSAKWTAFTPIRRQAASPIAVLSA